MSGFLFLTTPFPTSPWLYSHSSSSSQLFIALTRKLSPAGDTFVIRAEVNGRDERFVILPVLHHAFCRWLPVVWHISLAFLTPNVLHHRRPIGGNCFHHTLSCSTGPSMHRQRRLHLCCTGSLQWGLVFAPPGVAAMHPPCEGCVADPPSVTLSARGTFVHGCACTTFPWQAVVLWHGPTVTGETSLFLVRVVGDI